MRKLGRQARERGLEGDGHGQRREARRKRDREVNSIVQGSPGQTISVVINSCPVHNHCACLTALLSLLPPSSHQHSQHFSLPFTPKTLPSHSHAPYLPTFLSSFPSSLYPSPHKTLLCLFDVFPSLQSSCPYPTSLPFVCLFPPSLPHPTTAHFPHSPSLSLSRLTTTTKQCQIQCSAKYPDGRSLRSTTFTTWMPLMNDLERLPH